MSIASPGLNRSPLALHAVPPFRADLPIDSTIFASIRRRMILDCCKWDPQVSDVSTLATFPLLMNENHWNELCRLLEDLTRELFAAEEELSHRPELHEILGIPRSIRRILRGIDRTGVSPAPVRAMRFDFHWTTQGWRISEVNSDVPGGFSEAGEFTRMMSAHVPSTTTPGDPAQLWTGALANAVEGRDIALMAAPGFMEDQQVISYMARRLAERGFRTHLIAPAQIIWQQGHALLATAWHDGLLAAIVRFHQAEWFAHLPQRFDWKYFFAGAKIPIVNPGIAILSESKRFALTWSHLAAQMPTWRMLLPETRDPRDVDWRRDEGWLIKTAFCNTGDTVTARQDSTPRQWRIAAWSARLKPRQWVAQRRFEPAPIPSPIGEIFPCIGVYTINGRACGAYTRISPRRIVDYRAIDAALLIEREQK